VKPKKGKAAEKMEGDLSEGSGEEALKRLQNSAKRAPIKKHLNGIVEEIEENKLQGIIRSIKIGFSNSVGDGG